MKLYIIVNKATEEPYRGRNGAAGNNPNIKVYETRTRAETALKLTSKGRETYSVGYWSTPDNTRNFSDLEVREFEV